MFDLYAQLLAGSDEKRRHIKALSRMTTEHDQHELFDHLYGCLSILDSKSSSLLSFNSIIIAVFAILMTGDLVPLQSATVTVGMVSILTSCLLLLWVVWVYWSTTEDLADLERYALILLDVRRRRTIIYRLAWYLAVLAVISLATFVTLEVTTRTP